MEQVGFCVSGFSTLDEYWLYLEKTILEIFSLNVDVKWLSALHLGLQLESTGLQSQEY